MRIVETKVYQYSELSESAQSKARDWYRDCMDNSDYSEGVIDDALQVAAILGIEIATRPVRLMSGGTRQDPCVYWSGFSSQGDGACFEGWYSYKKGSCKAIRDYAPQDKVLHDIADQLQAWQKVNFYRLQAKMQHRGHYYHSGCMKVDVHDHENEWRDVPADGIADQMRAFADWIYRNLEKEYEYQTSDERLAESEYEFTVDGGIA